MCLGFSKLLGTVSCVKYVSTYLGYIIKKKRGSEKDLFDDDYAIFFPDFVHKDICGGYSSELHQQVDAIQMGIHNICHYKEVDKNYTGCNMKTTKLLDCALIGVCAVIRSNMVLYKETRNVLIWHVCPHPGPPSSTCRHFAKKLSWKRAIILIIIGRFYPKSNLTYILFYTVCHQVCEFTRDVRNELLIVL